MQNFALKSCNGSVHRAPRILHSEKFCAQEMEIPRSNNGHSARIKCKISPMPWKVDFFRTNSAHFRAAVLKSKYRAKFRDRGILEELIISTIGPAVHCLHDRSCNPSVMDQRSAAKSNSKTFQVGEEDGGGGREGDESGTYLIPAQGYKVLRYHYLET